MKILFCLLLLLAVGGSSASKSQRDFCRNEGQKREHEWDNQRFWQCIDNRWQLQFCQVNYFFDNVIGFCVLVHRPTISPPKRICTPGDRRQDIFDNTRYFQCSSDGKEWIPRFCHPGSLYDPIDEVCRNIRPTPTRPWPTRTTTTPYYTTTTTPYYGACKESGGRDGYKPDINSCKNFYKCASGLWTQMSCGEGTIWNQEILTCDHNRGQCRLPHSTHYPPTRPTFSPTWRPTTYSPIEFKK